MAVRKKKTIAKKKTAAKKAAKKTAKKSAKKAVKNKSVKKKTAKTSPTKAVKKAVPKKKSGGNKVAAKPHVGQKRVGSSSTLTAAQPEQKRSRKSKGGLKPGIHVRVRAGRNAGESGRIVRQDEFLGTYFMNFDRCRKDPVYHNIEWGPYFASQLDVA